MFVTAQQFDVIPYSIPNLNKVLNSFNDYVDSQEEYILKSLLGSSLYKTFIEGLEEDPIPEKWVKLRNGAEYEHLNKVYEYTGLVKLLQPYIYAMWLRDTYDSHSANGIVISKNENSETISPSTRICRAYNTFSDLAGRHCFQPNTLYGFLHANKELYQKWEFTEPSKMNIFNL